MQVIILTDKQRNLQIHRHHIALAVMGISFVILMLSILIAFAGTRFLVGRSEANPADMNGSIDTLAKLLGETQARLSRMEALSKEVTDILGVEKQKLEQDATGPNQPQGGPLDQSARSFTPEELREQILQLNKSIEKRIDEFAVFQQTAVDLKRENSLIPNRSPVATGTFKSSSYGYRIDPITGRRSFHPGVDYVTPVGTPIHAAAGGVVIAAEYNNGGYGYMVDIDHNNGITTRYAHNSKLLVKANDIVKPGQVIALAGSTGRSTGPHLHFEVIEDGQKRNPMLYLKHFPHPAIENFASPEQEIRDTLETGEIQNATQAVPPADKTNQIVPQ